MNSRLLRVQLGDVTQNRDGERIALSPRQCGLRPGEYPYYGQEGLIARIDSYVYEGDHVLTAAPPRGGPWAFAVQGRFSAGTRVHVLSCGPEAEAPFLCRILNALTPPRTAGLKELEALELSLPLPEVQRLILKALVNIEEKIALLQDQNRVLSGMIRALFDLFFISGGEIPRPLGDFAGYRPADPGSASATGPASTPEAGAAAESPAEISFGGLSLYPRGDLHPLFIAALIQHPEFLAYAENRAGGGGGKHRLDGERLMAFELNCPREGGGRRDRRENGVHGEFNRFARTAEKKLAHNKEELRILRNLQRSLVLL
ncbi:MAG: hypothetical protein LBH51_07240 [Treponema sp.]|nr:hypothetical protein [Treponema sp.]